MHSELLKGVYPTCVQFKFNINSTRSEKVRKTWDQAIKECKENMTKALLNDIFTKYESLKDQIGKDYDQLALILDEVKDSLRKRDVGMAPILEHRSGRQYEQPKPQVRPRPRKFIKPESRRKGQQRSKNRMMDNNSIILSSSSKRCSTNRLTPTLCNCLLHCYHNVDLVIILINLILFVPYLYMFYHNKFSFKMKGA